MSVIFYNNLMYAGGGSSESGGGTEYPHEIVRQRNVYCADGTVITLNLTKKYTNPYVMPCNIVPLSSWGGLVVIQDTSAISYDSSNDTVTFSVYTNGAQYFNIDWIVFESDVAGGGSSGSGGGTSATVLYDNPNDSSTFTTITLNDAYTNYDAIVITGCAIAANSTWLDSQIYYVNELKTGDRVGFTDNGAYTWYEVTNSTTLTHIEGAYYLIRCVIGLKFNSGSSQGGIDYSLNEQDTGLKWIDGSPVYQKTYQHNSVVSVNGYVILDTSIKQSDIAFLETVQLSMRIDSGTAPNLYSNTINGLHAEVATNNTGLYFENTTPYDVISFTLTVRYAKSS